MSLSQNSEPPRDFSRNSVNDQFKDTYKPQFPETGEDAKSAIAQAASNNRQYQSFLQKKKEPSFVPMETISE